MAFSVFSRTSFAAVANARSVITAIADVSGDGVADLIVSQSFVFTDGTSLAPIKILIATAVNNASGPTGFIDRSPDYLTNGGPQVHLARRILTGDFNQDGKSDIFLSTTGIDAPPFSGERNVLMLSTPSGKLIDASGTLPNLLDYSHSAIVVDVNGDKAPDILVNNNANKVAAVDPYLLMNNGSGTFAKNTSRLPESVAIPGKFESDSVAAADFNNDGYVDLAFGSSDANRFFTHPGTVYLNNSQGNFSTSRSIALPNGPFGVGESTPTIQAVDLNGDGWTDLLLNQVGAPPPGGGPYSGGRLAVYINEKGGGFSDQSAVYLNNVVTIGRNNYADRLTIVDQNGDGRPDVFITYTVLPADTDPVFLINNGPNQPFSFITAGDIRKADPGYNGNSQITQATNGDITLINTSLNNTTGVITVTTLTEIGVGAPRVTALTENSDQYVGTGYRNILALLGGNDVAEGKGGDDVIDGGAGVDTVVFSGRRQDYYVAGVDGKTYVGDVVIGRDGTDSLSNVEFLRFSDRTIAAPTSSSPIGVAIADQLATVYLGRGVNPDWRAATASVVSSGASVDIQKAFFAAGVVDGAFSAADSTEAITNKTFLNIFGVGASSFEQAAWSSSVAKGYVTKESLPWTIFNSYLGATNVPASYQVPAQSRIIAINKFTDSVGRADSSIGDLGAPSADAARAWLRPIRSPTDAFTKIQTVDNTVASLSLPIAKGGLSNPVVASVTVFDWRDTLPIIGGSATDHGF